MFWKIGNSGLHNIAAADNRASAIAQLQSLLHGVGMIGEALAARVRAFGITGRRQPRPAYSPSHALARRPKRSRPVERRRLSS